MLPANALLAYILVDAYGSAFDATAVVVVFSSGDCRTAAPAGF
jgi:hypothetical protein